MNFLWLTHLEALAICFASCGVILMLTVYFIARTSRDGDAGSPVAAGEPETRPADLEALRMEGYQVLEIYDDAEHWGNRPQGSRGWISERIVRTAKVRDPETGRVLLIRVQTLVKPW